MKENKIIEINHLKVTFDDREVLKDVSFTITQGDVTVILGGSGSGKSTILKHILGLFPVEAGVVNLLDQDIATLKEKDELDFYLKLGVFYQNGALLNSLTVGDNVALPLEQHTDLPPQLIEEMVRTKLNLVNLEDAYYLYPSQLSGGMLKRAALARAIILDPPVLFCDEPGAGLDPVSLAALDELILKLRDQLGMTVVMVTHEVSSILRIADKILFVEDGVIGFDGTLEEARKSPLPSLKDFFTVGTGGKKG
ncbi:ABC transporter ATP-binding protein [Marinilabilia salmonicolor]|jgi:phospholipid/cholesterol/gamma-HCH transport system ATP-binding protein|uniref:Phospholipid/cholesterol/gamma-HCH transport system ATP-binding protein n=1 Tax=Marinilabilia salmonicolor TaxID=989 RepID=A0A2T0XT99_9BACT|nr:ATP-binding cassette domain-containing protein [Marinilabilia salmonicolor]PRZ02175.1 phospholipid/cholesterol/gamma-HCH transport system ATP-binding protein [Marinilabilia salmonicolor]RCW36130.1 phospholipid/cholesterol/gamma-HCH transport system ATP-binding protein [Marinilabilia salmonicolor]